MDVTEPVKVFIQLRRPSDGATSEPLPFEFLPLDSGRRPYWSCKRNLYKREHYEFLNNILTKDTKLLTNQHGPLLEKSESVSQPKHSIALVSDENINYSAENNTGSNLINENIINSSKTLRNIEDNNNIKIEKSFDQIIQQVDEIDEIYCQNQSLMLKLLVNNKEDSKINNSNEFFDDTKTYSSLQLAFKNPVDINKNRYEDVVEASSNLLLVKDDVNYSKRENETERPPLPPKRTKKIETFIGETNESEQLCKNYQRLSSDLGTMPDNCSLSTNFCSSHSQLEVPLKHLPVTPTPNSATLPNPKKRSFFSKLFGKKSKTANNSRETSVTPSINKQIYSSSKSLQAGNTLTKSIGNVSTVSSNSIRIPLKDYVSTQNRDNLETPSDTTTVGVVSETHYIKNDDFDMNLDITEAEHYALYTTVAPYATQSEFDEMSCYYAPVEGRK